MSKVIINNADLFFPLLPPYIADTLNTYTEVNVAFHSDGKRFVTTSISGEKCHLGAAFFRKIPKEIRDRIKQTAKDGAKDFLEAFFPKEKKVVRLSRSSRFQEALDSVSNARGVAEELKEELENWKDNLPENLQEGSKADALETAMSELDDFIMDCENAEGHSVDFPSMFG